MKCISPLYVNKKVVPCGKCNYCRQLRALDWAFRLSIENRYAHSAYFVTLTLRFAPQSGVSKRHLQLFFKRLRIGQERDKRSPFSKTKIVYYAVAEYGERTMRPHYHAVIFNADESHLARAWKLGRIHIGKVNDRSVAYVVSYSIKGSRCPRGQRKPFSLMSRRPAIGSQYLKTHTDWHRGGQAVADAVGVDAWGEIIYQESDVDKFKSYTNVNGVRGHLPRFYRDKMFTHKERTLLNAINMAAMDAQFRKQIDHLVNKGYTEASAFNYVNEAHLAHHDLLYSKLIKNESI